MVITVTLIIIIIITLLACLVSVIFLYLCCLCNWPIGSQTSMYINKDLNIIIALLYFCVQLITSAHILCTLTFSDISSNFRSVALPTLHTARSASATRVTPVAHQLSTKKSKVK